jgi:hypothetical protein
MTTKIISHIFKLQRQQLQLEAQQFQLQNTQLLAIADKSQSELQQLITDIKYGYIYLIYGIVQGEINIYVG